MATNDVTKSPEQLEEEERLRQQAAEELRNRELVQPATGEDRAQMLKQAGVAEVPATPKEQQVSAAPEVTGLRKIAPAAGEVPVTVPKQLPAIAPPTRADQLRSRLNTLEAPPDTLASHGTVLGKIGHVLGRIGNVAGDITGATANVPGTDLYRRLEAERTQRALGQEETRESEAGLRKIQEQNLQSEMEARQNPKAKLLTGEENVATDAQGNRYRAYENPADQSVSWVPEGQAAPGGLRTIAPPSVPTGGLPAIAPPAPVPGLPTGATVGKPKTPTDEEKFTTEFLKDNKLDDTAENRAKARAAYTSGGGIGADQAKQLSTQIGNVLKGTGIDASGYQISEKSTRAEGAEALRAAQAAANEERTRNAPEAAQSRKDARTMGYALDADGNLKFMSKADADKIHSTFEEMKSGDVNKDRQALRQLNDVQMNTSRYRKAIDAIPEDIPANHALLMQQIVGDEKIHAGIVAGALPGADYILNTLKGTNIANQWNELSKPEREVVIGYLRAKGSVIAYQKALSGIGRTNKEMLDIEMNNLPLPFVGASVADQQLAAWQENVDRASDGFPRNLPGVKHPSEIREQLEGKQKKEPEGGAPPAGAKIRTYNPATGQLE